MSLAEVSIRRPVFAWMLTAAIVTLGWISLGRLGVDLFPNVQLPVVTITTVLQGAGPETIETEITEVVEEHVNTVSGIDGLLSISSEGVSQVFVWFELEVDPDVATQAVRDKVAIARQDLPVDAEPPVVDKLDPDATPILAVMVAGERPVGELTRFADDVVKERLQRVLGVGSVAMVGGREREIRVWLDAWRLRAYGLTADDVVQALRAEHAEIPGGRLETGGRTAEFAFKTRGEVESVAEFGEIVIGWREEAGPVRVRDVARVEDGLEDERTYAELDGEPGVSLLVRRQSGRNTVEVARAVVAEVEALRREAPPGTRIEIAQDVSRFIETSVRDVGVDMLLGGALAIAITAVFLLSLRTTLIVSLAIPTSVIGSFFLFYMAGFTLNILTLMALSVSTGILVDDAIVVLENIHRHLELGEPPLEAALRGTEEIASAVVASTISIFAVFVPIAFMQGMVGRFFFEYGLTVVFAVGVSLLVALTLTPSLCARVLRRDSATAHGGVFRAFDRGYVAMERGYRRLLEVSLRHRLLVLGVALASVLVAIPLARSIPLEFSGRVDRSEFEARVDMPLGTGIEETRRAAHAASAALRELPEVRKVFSSIGSGSRARVDQAAIYVQLTGKQERERDMFEVMDAARAALARAVPQAKRIAAHEIPWVSGGGMGSYHVHYSISGPSLAELESRSEAIADRLRADPIFTDVRSSYESGRPEVRAEVDRRRAADLGVSLRSLALTLRTLVGGVDAVSYQENGQRFDVRAQLDPAQRDEIAELELAQVRARDGSLVDFTNVARLEVGSGPVQIDREDRSRKVDVFANARAGVALGTAAERVDAIAAEVGLPAGYAGHHRGMAERMRESADAVTFAFALALVALYMILASQFNSFVQPAITMLTAPLSFVGAFVALAISGVDLSLFAQIAFVALMGLVMKNGILLVDYANQVRERVGSAREAMLEAGPVRLRPVLMTAFSTVFGMIPVAISTADGAEWRNPMGILGVGGMLSSTLLTLVVVPVVYTLVEDWTALAARALARLRALVGPRSAAAAAQHASGGSAEA
jgi:HAE1 family hydrophobic/amphiphilic exporter-1